MKPKQPAIFKWALTLWLLPLIAASAGEVAQWEVFEASFVTGKHYDNPFTDLEVDVSFTSGDGQWTVPAFWAGDGRWTVRFAPPHTGEYRYHVRSTDASNPDLNGSDQTLKVHAYTGSNPLLRHGFLRVNQDGHYFEHADGTPFFWLGDTWWKNLCKRMTWEGFKQLTADRQAKGFSVIQIVCGPYPDEGWFDPRLANEGGMPYTSRDYVRANPAYFNAADRRLFHLVNAGLAPAIVGAWGRSDCNSMEAIGVAGLKRHWRYLVARYSAYPVFWILAGEIDTSTKWGEGPWAEVARYLRSIDPYHHPLTCHTARGRQGGEGDQLVIDFDMVGGSHSPDDVITANTVAILQEARSGKPAMPVLCGETGYESHMQNHFQYIQRHVFWMYALSGAAGHTYGAAGVWHASVDGDPGITPVYDFTTWREGMDFPGSSQLGFGKKLLDQYPWWRFEPHPEWAESDCFAAGIPGELRVVYQPRRNVYNWNGAVVKGIEPGAKYHAFYFDPAKGRKFDAGTFSRLDPEKGTFLRHTEETLFADTSENTVGKTAWTDHGTPSRHENGRLLGGKGMVTVINDINESNLTVSVKARSDAEAGIILRYTNPNNYLVALYTPSLKAIYLHDRKDGEWGPPLGSVSVPNLNGEITLAATVGEQRAIFSVADRDSTWCTPVVDIRHNTAPGAVGVWLFQIGERQEFRDFKASRFLGRLPENAIFSDAYIAPRLPSPQDWVLVLERTNP